MSRNILSNKPTGDALVLEKKLRNTKHGKLIFTRVRNRMCALLIREERLWAAQVLEETPSKIGAIYIAKVKNVVRNIDACFVEIADGEICFLPFKEASTAFLLNRSFGGRILEGDELLVQVTRDAQKTKQASVTARISLSNEAFAISLGSTRVGYSGKLSRERKQQISDLLEHHGIQHRGKLLHSSTEGLIVRTLAGELTDEALLEAWKQIKEQWCHLLQTASHRTCFSCLQEPPKDFETVLKQLVYPYEYEEILTDEESLFHQLQTYCEASLPEKKVRFYEDDTFSLSKLYSLETKLNTALCERVWLKSGGYLVIEPTEALTVIDVNSGKYEAKKANQDMVFKVNCEAAEEIALQLRLRNLSGMIIVDFINMASTEQEEQLLELLRCAVRQDKQKTTVVDMTPLGLVEITRKKNYRPLQEQFQETVH